MFFASILSLILSAEEPKFAIHAISNANDADRNYGNGHSGNNADFIESLRNRVLPVSLLNFNGQSFENYNLLTWTTFSEERNSHFEIFKASGESEFKFIGSLAGALNSNDVLNYSYKDYDIANIENSYYKLRQVDIDGGFKDFKVLTLKARIPKTVFSTRLDEFNMLHLNFSTGKKEELKLNFYGLDGKLILNEKVFSNVGVNSHSFNLNSSIAPGVYILTVKGSTKIESLKVIK